MRERVVSNVAEVTDEAAVRNVLDAYHMEFDYRLEGGKLSFVAYDERALAVPYALEDEEPDEDDDSVVLDVDGIPMWPSYQLQQTKGPEGFCEMVAALGPYLKTPFRVLEFDPWSKHNLSLTGMHVEPGKVGVEIVRYLDAVPVRQSKERYYAKAPAPGKNLAT